LKEVKTVPKKLRTPYQQPKLIPKAPTNLEVYDTEVLKQELTRENYVEKFNHLLSCEEQEHHRILNEK
jgi:hypothetical protein